MLVQDEGSWSSEEHSHWSAQCPLLRRGQERRRSHAQSEASAGNSPHSHVFLTSVTPSHHLRDNHKRHFCLPGGLTVLTAMRCECKTTLFITAVSGDCHTHSRHTCLTPHSKSVTSHTSHKSNLNRAAGIPLKLVEEA